jgi:hypothetical protein
VPAPVARVTLVRVTVAPVTTVTGGRHLAEAVVPGVPWGRYIAATR